MARIVKEYDQRHEEILNTAQRFFYTKGYSQTSVQDIINSIGIAKGTFYHYFDSKLDMLEALVERLVSQSLEMFEGVANDDSLTALPKMTRLFNYLGNWKTARREELMVIIQALYRDENILLLHKIKERSFEAVTPTLASVIQQGIEEGVFDVKSAQDSAEIFIVTSTGFSESFGRLLLKNKDYQDPVSLIKRKKVAYEQAIERILGASPGSLPLFDEAIIEAWFEKDEIIEGNLRTEKEIFYERN